MATLFWFLLVMSFVVLVHEGGHYLAARRAGVPVTEFCLGFPGTPKLVTLFRYDGTAFTVRLLPLGGFVSFTNGTLADDDPLGGVTPGRQAAIYAAGSVANLLCGYLLLVIALVTIKDRALWEACREGFTLVVTMVRETARLFGGLLTGGGIEGLMGPVGIADVTGKIMAKGVDRFPGMAGILCISLGLTNLLPIPILDGGHLFILAGEKLLGRRLSTTWRYRITMAGAAALLTLFACATWNDIATLMG